MHTAQSDEPTAQTDKPTSQKPLRLWPGVIAVVLEWVLWFIVSFLVMIAAVFFFPELALWLPRRLGY